MAEAVVLIPARLASTRFPEKVLADRTGHPLIGHVCMQARKARCAQRVVAAVDDERVARAVEPYADEVVMTRQDHPNGASRCAEAADLLGLADQTIVLNVQADEPEIDPAALDALAEAMREEQELPMATLASPYPKGADPADPNIVKVVCDRRSCALYFSRSPIPHGAGEQLRKHVGVYAYRGWLLRRYAAWSPTPLERAERLEQLRALEHGCSIRVVEIAAPHAGVDTPEQYEAFVQRWTAAEQGRDSG